MLMFASFLLACIFFYNFGHFLGKDEGKKEAELSRKPQYLDSTSLMIISVCKGCYDRTKHSDIFNALKWKLNESYSLSNEKPELGISDFDAIKKINDVAFVVCTPSILHNFIEYSLNSLDYNKEFYNVMLTTLIGAIQFIDDPVILDQVEKYRILNHIPAEKVCLPYTQ